jgi:hypothetical protein
MNLAHIRVHAISWHPGCVPNSRRELRHSMTIIFVKVFPRQDRRPHAGPALEIPSGRNCLSKGKKPAARSDL